MPCTSTRYLSAQGCSQKAPLKMKPESNHTTATIQNEAKSTDQTAPGSGGSQGAARGHTSVGACIPHERATGEAVPIRSPRLPQPTWRPRGPRADQAFDLSTGSRVATAPCDPLATARPRGTRVAEADRTARAGPLLPVGWVTPAGIRHEPSHSPWSYGIVSRPPNMWGRQLPADACPAQQAEGPAGSLVGFTGD